MAIALAHTYSNNAPIGTSLTITISVSPAAGAVLIAAISLGIGAASITLSGWTHVGNIANTNQQFDVWTKTATGSETSVPWTWTNSSKSSGFYMEYTGSDGNLYGFASTTGTTGSAITSPTLSSVPSGAMSVAGGAQRVSGGGAMSCTVTGTGWSEASGSDNSSSGLGANYGSCAASNSTSTGSVTGATFTFTGTSTDLEAFSLYLILPTSNLSSDLMLASL